MGAVFVFYEVLTDINQILTKRVAIGKIIEYHMRMFLDEIGEICKEFLTDWVHRAF